MKYKHHLYLIFKIDRGIISRRGVYRMDEHALIIDGMKYWNLTHSSKMKCKDKLPAHVIQGWLRQDATIELMILWEKENNPNFNEEAARELQKRLHTTSFTLTQKQ